MLPDNSVTYLPGCSVKELTEQSGFLTEVVQVPVLDSKVVVSEPGELRAVSESHTNCHQTSA